jgi:hypothetical protein
MHFFRSREDADLWAADREAVTVLSIGEGDELAQEHWVQRLRLAAG